MSAHGQDRLRPIGFRVNTTITSEAEAVCAFTVDVEGFAESCAQSVAVPSEYLATERSDAEIEANLDAVLTCLAQWSCQATFFFLGRIGRSAPQLVQRVIAAGHEIGCHSLEHLRISGQTQEEFGSHVREAKGLLEDASGQPVLGFRAPDFSIGRTNLWAIDELLAAGFVYDSSIVPTGLHDAYGMTGTPRRIFRWPNGLIEFPLPVVRILGGDFPIGGGGYFRLYPIGWTRRYYHSQSRRRNPTAFYIHPYEIGSIRPRLPRLSPLRRFRHYVGMKSGRKRIGTLLGAVRFATMAHVLECAGHLAGE